jgi:hypothetical protein
MVIKEAVSIVENSFLITGRGIILELMHTEDGLGQGTLLESHITDRSWVVKARILFDHAEEYQKKFNSEMTEFMLLKFKIIEEREKSIKNILMKEKNNIYQYLVSPIGHEMKPENNERLKIIGGSYPK